MNYSSKQIIILLAIVPNIIAALVAIIRWRRLPTFLFPLTILVVFSLATEVVSRILWVFKISNLFIWPIYISAEFGLLLWLYSRVIGKNLLLIRYGWFFIGGLAFLATLEVIPNSSQSLAIANVARMLESVLVISLALAYYHISLRQPTTAYIWQEPMFWVSSGLLLFFAGNFLVYTFIKFMYYYHKQLLMGVWIVHNSLGSLLYCTYAYALWISPKK